MDIDPQTKHTERPLELSPEQAETADWYLEKLGLEEEADSMMSHKTEAGVTHERTLRWFLGNYSSLLDEMELDQARMFVAALRQGQPNGD